MGRISGPISLRSFHQNPNRRWNICFSILTLLVLASVSCNLSALGAPSSPHFIPFTQDSCPGSPSKILPKAQVAPNGASINCQYKGVINDQESGEPQGVLYLTLNYLADPEVAKKSFDEYQSRLDSQARTDKSNKGSQQDDESLPYGQDQEVFVMEFPNGTQHPDDSMYALILYKNHFVIYITGSTVYTDPESAIALVDATAKDGMYLADLHYH